MKKIITFLVVVQLLLAIGSGYAKDKIPTVVVPPAKNAEVVNGYDKLMDYLLTEKKSIAEESSKQYEMMKSIFQQERESLGNIFEMAVKILTGGLIFVSALIGFLFWDIKASQKSVFQNIKDSQEGVFQNFRDTQRVTIEEQGSILRKKLAADYNELEKSLLNEAMSKEKEISNFIKEQSDYKNKRIAWIYAEESMSDTVVIESLKKNGVKNISEIIAAEHIGLDRDQQQYQVIIFSICDGDSINRHLGKILEKLDRLGAYPLIIYTYDKGGKQIRLEGKDWDILDRYGNYTVANFPGSLQTTLNSMLRWS